MEISLVPSTYLVKDLLHFWKNQKAQTQTHQTTQSLLWNRKMLLKIGTNFEPHEKLLPVLRAVSTLFKEHKSFMVITSLKDREHSPSSKHYIGQAFDVRKKHLDESVINQISTDLNHIDAKVIDYDTHWHIEVK